MGAWGTGVFDDDIAYDVVDELKAAQDPREVFARAFDVADGPLGEDECHAITVSAAFIDILLFGTPHRVDAPEVNLLPFRQKHRDLPIADLAPRAVVALHRVLAADSELNEIWLSNAEKYPEWRATIEA